MYDERRLKSEMNTAKRIGYEDGHKEGRADGLAEGRAEGRAEGHAEGRAETQAEIARKMLMSGMPIEQICAFTGLDVAAVEALKTEE